MSSRDEFEAWWEINYHNGNPPRFGWAAWRDGDGYKIDDDESEFDGMWQAWQAATNAMEAKCAALAAELEAAQKSNEFLKGQLSELANFNPDWDKLEASYESWREIAAELLVAKDRIAELEAREVVLPQRHSMLHRDNFDEPYHTEFVYKQHQVLEALHDAGIITKVGE